MPQIRVGVDIGSTAVRAAELSMRSVPPKLVRIAQVPLAPGTVSNGEVKDPQGVADALRELWHQAKFRPVGVDLVPFAIVRSVGMIDGSGLQGSQGGDEAIVDIGADVTSICVHAWGVPRFVRILPTGGRDVTAAVARAMGVPEDEAEALKRGMPGANPHKREEAMKAAL